MTRSRWALRRLGFALPVVLGITTLTFTLIHLAPGDPLYLLAGDGGSPSYYADMRAKFGLDRPLLDQFARYVRAGVTGDFGYSFTYEAPVLRVIGGHAPASLLLGVTALLLSVAGGVGLACLSVFYRSGAIDAAIRIACAVVYAAPVFWTGQILILVFALWLGVVPVAGMTTARESFRGPAFTMDVAHHLILPALALSLPFMAVVARVARASLRTALDEPFVHAARARGLSYRRVVILHAAPPAAVALVTLVGQHAPQIVAGAAFTEYLFGWPGLGSVILHASLHRDYPLVTSSFLIVSAAVVGCSALADLVCAWLDPRVSLS
ncbi:MAG: ABC transporter permease [Acidobacteriota bacterium]